MTVLRSLIDETWGEDPRRKAWERESAYFDSVCERAAKRLYGGETKPEAALLLADQLFEELHECLDIELAEIIEERRSWEELGVWRVRAEGCLLALDRLYHNYYPRRRGQR